MGQATALILFVFFPLGWALTGRLLGTAGSLTVPTERGQRLGGRLGRVSMWFFPALYYLLFALGGSGNAGSGFRVFGSEELFALLCLPCYAVPALGVYVLVLYVIHDLIRGLRARQA